jgi:hypothetical protein
MTSLLRLAVGAALLTALKAAPPVSLEQHFSELRKSPPELYAFLLRMPKGGDLHNHLAGAIYAESFIRAAAASHLCFDKRDWRVLPTCSGPNQEPANEVNHDNAAFNDVIDTFSMRDFVPGQKSAHDHFFDSFGLFALADNGHTGEFVAELSRRAAEQNESYLELMALAGSAEVNRIGATVGLSDSFDKSAENLRSAGMPALVSQLKSKVDEIEKQRIANLHCDTEPSSAPCKVVIRYVYQVLREFPKEQVFAQTLAGFALASMDPRVVAVNFVQPEDGINAMRNYHLHMQMIAFAKRLYPNVHITLHAGELASGLVPPEGLRFHIREAIEIGHAERIGHGVDIMYETGAEEMLKQMHAQRLAVEIALTSNDLILGVKGIDHPFPIYRKYGVPVVLVTDDEGVNRSHLTQEYQRAVLTYGLTYADVKQIVRNGIEYSFLSGASYWTDATYRMVTKPCAAGIHTASCQAFLAASDKATMQADLENRFRKFEADTIKK